MKRCRLYLEEFIWHVQKHLLNSELILRLENGLVLESGGGGGGGGGSSSNGGAGGCGGGGVGGLY